MATITVYFKPIVIGSVTLPYYHQFIVYQPDDGAAQFLRGGPAAYFEPLGTVADVSYYHETLVYTNASGTTEYLTSGPTQQPALTSMASTLSAITTAETNTTSNTPSAWRTLQSWNGTLDGPNSQDSAVGKTEDASGNPYQSTVIATGSDLSSTWATMIQAENQISDEGYTYAPLSQKSNSINAGLEKKNQ